MDHARLLDVYLQLEYLDDLRHSNPSPRLASEIDVVEAALVDALRQLGVSDLEEFKRRCRDEIERQAHPAKHLEHA